MDNSLLAVRDINHKYIVVGRRKVIMTKELKRMSFMALAVMMLAGGFLLASGKSQHVMPKKAVADITETVPETGTDEIVAGDEEVPL